MVLVDTHTLTNRLTFALGMAPVALIPSSQATTNISVGFNERGIWGSGTSLSIEFSDTDQNIIQVIGIR